MKPSVGRIVHFYHMAKDAPSGTTAPCAAIITHVFDEPDDAVNLVVFQNGAVCFESIVSTKDYNDFRYWTWPPRDAAPAPAVIDPKALPAPAVPEAVILSGYVPAFEVESFDPNRRTDLTRMSTGERSLYYAQGYIEEMFGDDEHPWLADAIVLLAKVQEKVADYIDRISRPGFEPPVEGEQRVDDTGEDIDPGLRA